LQVSILMKSSYLKSQLLYMPMMTLILQSKTIFLEVRLCIWNFHLEFTF
jgi:hypothetical protein